jgi:hypothetical protein
MIKADAIKKSDLISNAQKRTVIATNSDATNQIQQYPEDLAIAVLILKIGKKSIQTILMPIEILLRMLVAFFSEMFFPSSVVIFPPF